MKAAAAALLALVCAATGCAPAQPVYRKPQLAVRAEAPRTIVVLEPFFENAEVTYRKDLQPVAVPDRSIGSTRQYVTVQTPVKPLLARPDSLQDEHQRAVSAIRALRPTWQVESTVQLPPLQGPLVLVRTMVGGTVHQPNGSRGLITALPFLWGAAITDVLNVEGRVQRFAVDADQLRTRILRYPATPDFAVDTEGLQGEGQPFTIEVAYQENVFTDPSTRTEAIVQGFAQRLAETVVSLVESAEQ